MSVSKLQIDTELHAAEHALKTAADRRDSAEHALWEAVSASGKKGRKWRRRERVEGARAELAEAEKLLAEVQAQVGDLRWKLAQAQERETRLQAITDMLIARDEARRANGNYSGNGGNGGSAHKPSWPLSFLDWFRRH